MDFDCPFDIDFDDIDFDLKIEQSMERERQKNEEKKTTGRVTRLSTATDEQKFIHDDFLKRCHDIKNNGEGQTPPIFAIKGFAGSGKTWLSAQIVETLMEEKFTVAVTTPTHKAVNVAKKMLEENNIETEFGNLILKTIHSFLNLKIDYGFGEDGTADNVTTKPKLIVNKFNECLDYVDVLIIDEASMVGNEIYDNVLSIIGDRAKIVLFIGDSFQLLPVEDDENFIFDRTDITHYSLTKIIRQQEDSGIIQKSQELINLIKTKQYPASIFDIFHESSNNVELINTGAELLDHYFKNENELKMTGAFTNKTVDEYNNFIRYTVQDNVLDYIHEDDTLVFQSPCTNSKGDILFNNGEVVELTQAVKGQDRVYDFDIWKCKANGINFNILDPASQDDYFDQLTKFKNDALKAQGYEKSKSWKSYFKLLSKFAKVKYNYSSTVHKLQGSTYNDMYFDMRGLDYFYKKNKDSVLRLCYVAITRASDNVYILKY